MCVCAQSVCARAHISRTHMRACVCAHTSIFVAFCNYADMHDEVMRLCAPAFLLYFVITQTCMETMCGVRTSIFVVFCNYTDLHGENVCVCAPENVCERAPVWLLIFVITQTCMARMSLSESSHAHSTWSTISEKSDRGLFYCMKQQ